MNNRKGISNNDFQKDCPSSEHFGECLNRAICCVMNHHLNKCIYNTKIDNNTKFYDVHIRDKTLLK